jgi:hypothetical protein
MVMLNVRNVKVVVMFQMKMLKKKKMEIVL